MKKNNMIMKALQELLTEKEVEEFAKQSGYIVVSRKITVYNLLQYLCAASIEQSASFRETVYYAPKYDLKQVSYSGLSRKTDEVPYHIFKSVFDLLIKKCNRKARRTLKLDKRILAIDSTTITASKTQLKWAGFHGQKGGVKLHVQFDVDSYMPTRIEESIARKHDFPIGEKLTNPECVIVEDRAYGKIAKFDEFTTQENKQLFVIRIKENLTLVKPRRLRRLVPEDSNIINDITCRLGTTQKRSINRFRVVSFNDGKGNEIKVCTNIMTVSAEVIAEIYKARWTIETFFRFIKQNLNVSRIFGTTTNSVFNQLFASLIVFVIVLFLYSESSKKWRYVKLSLGEFLRKLRLNDLETEIYISIFSVLAQRRTIF